MSSASLVAPDETVSFTETLNRLGEYFAAGFMHEYPDSQTDLPVILRMARGIQNHLQRCPLPRYRGEMFYPMGCSFWDNGAAVWHHYVKLSYDKNRLAAKRERAETDEERAALDALESHWAAYPGAGGYTHSIPNYGRVLREGLNGYEQRILRERQSALLADDQVKIDLYDALLRVLKSIRKLHRRMVTAIEDGVCETPEQEQRRKRLLEALKVVPFHPARTFFEAMVGTHFIFTLDGSDNLGRFDQDLFPYYQENREAGRLLREDALEMVRELWRHVDECFAWNCAVGGTTPDGRDASNELTLLAIEAARSRRRPNLALRLRKDTPDPVWQAAFDTIATGCGLPALYCEENYHRALRNANLGLAEQDLLAHYAFGGCTETMVHGRSNVGSLDAGINLVRVLVETLHGSELRHDSFEQVLAAYKVRLKQETERITESVSQSQRTKARFYPQLIRSLLIDDCIDNGREYAAGGARYNWSVINIEGMANVIDSLAAVRDVVFEKREATFGELLAALREDFISKETLRKRLEQCPRFGNGDERADSIARDLSSFVFHEFLSRAPWRGGKFLPACLMFVTYANAGKGVGATPDGRRANAPIADSAGAYHGRDRSGPTSLLRSVTCLDQIHAPGTLVVNIRFAKRVFKSEAMRSKLKALIKTYFEMGGMQIQINVVDQTVLRDALEHPERHENLIIRIGGYSEYWNRLGRDLQLTVLERTEHESNEV